MLGVFGAASASAAIVQSGNNIKLFEAVFESMPQLYIQIIVLFGGLLDGDPAIVYASLSLSVLSTAQVCAITVCVEKRFDAAESNNK